MNRTASRLFSHIGQTVLAFILALSGLLIAAPAQEASAAAGSKIIVGYWHNFDNGSTNIRLRDVSTDFDVIQIAFAEPVGGTTTGNMAFSPYNASVNDFKADIAYLQSIGKKVVISIGGANGTIELTTSQAKQNFVTTMEGIINTYGFNGIDIDLEGSSLSLNTGDSDFKNPTTPKIVNLISAVREIMGSYGSDFLLTMAPETAYVQGGYTAYGGPWGAYLPVIYGLRDQLDYLFVQHYNSGSLTGLDGKSYSQGTADFHVAMAEMLLAGFPVAGNSGNMFPALRQDQILIGLPASPQAAGGGYTSVSNVQKALNYLVKGQSFGGSYVLRNPAGYPDMKGLMTWSVNWDKYNNFEFSSNHRAFLNQLSGGGGGDLIAPSAPGNLRPTGKSASSVSLAWDASTDNVGVTGYTVSYGSSAVNVSGTSVTVNGLSANTAYTFTVIARDAAGNVSGASNSVTVTTDNSGGNACTEAAWSSSAVYTKGMRVSYNGKVYEAQWWTQGDRPDQSGEWGVWRLVGTCEGSTGQDDVIAPTAPTNLQVTGKSTSSVSLGWSASSDDFGVTGYIVSYGTSTVNVTGTSAVITGLSAGTTYTFTVKARDAAGNISSGASISATTDSGQTGETTWAAGVSYKVNDEVTYAGKAYICLQSHTSQQGWEPPNVPALWKLK